MIVFSQQKRCDLLKSVEATLYELDEEFSTFLTLLKHDMYGSF